MLPDEGGSQVGGQLVELTVESLDDGAVRLVGDGFDVEVRADVEADRFAATRGRAPGVFGNGFAPGSTASVLLRSEPYDLGDIVVDDDATFELTSGRIPAQVTACPHTLHGGAPGGSGHPCLADLPVQENLACSTMSSRVMLRNVIGG